MRKPRKVSIESARGLGTLSRNGVNKYMNDYGSPVKLAPAKNAIKKPEAKHTTYIVCQNHDCGQPHPIENYKAEDRDVKCPTCGTGVLIQKDGGVRISGVNIAFKTVDPNKETGNCYGKYVKEGELLVAEDTDFNITRDKVYTALAKPHHDMVTILNDKGNEEDYSVEYFRFYKGETVGGL